MPSSWTETERKDGAQKKCNDTEINCSLEKFDVFYSWLYIPETNLAIEQLLKIHFL